MSDLEKQESNKEAVPFFAQFLEDQACQEISASESASIKGGHKGAQKGGTVTTFKYPSDNEDVGGGFTLR